ncbi:MAG: protease PrsW [Caldilineae bacterium]|nr:MAG: protease PrsW [Caldilineae bacterium]
MFMPLLASLIAAVMPTVFYVFLIWWSDRYEREPGWLLGIVFLWGAVPAIVLSLPAELLLHQPLSPERLGLGGSLLQVAAVAPVVEEMAKGLALLGLVLFVRSELDDVLDGIVYGALIGFGFAMTENFFYFVGTALEGGTGDFLLITFLRAIVFGLNHAFYTAITGAFFGLAAMKGRRPHRWRLPVYGLLLAILVHALHNLTTSLSATNPLLFLVSIFLDWGGVLVLVLVIVLAWQQEKEWIRQHLKDEVPHILSQEQYALLLAHPQRLGGLIALLVGKHSRQAALEAALHRTATELAFRKHRLQVRGADADPRLVASVEELRKQVRSLAEQHAQLA